MTNRFTLSQKSKIDIKRITKQSIKDFGKSQTDKYMAGLKDTLQMLANNPERGKRLSSKITGNKHYQHYRYVSHVIYYRQRKADIFIIRILYKGMLPELHLPK